jgi:hypothetical protein
MNPSTTHPPSVEVLFVGRTTDDTTIDFCLQAARTLQPRTRRIDTCEVEIRKRRAVTELRIEIRTTEGDVVVDRIAMPADEDELRGELRELFAQAASGIDAARANRGSRPEVLTASAADAVAARAPAVEPPPCTWYG